ncbi:MAG: NrtA/SsuA/CpmA family ABC transporter substrate-binding protein [Alphaproteobacteria bacterium]|nr:NrtA/SsuA/CpmA family ABC transporter substrate-binding protein [Alphaproteobacteria bacterium]
MISLSRRGALLAAAAALAAPAVRAQTPRAIRVTYVSSPFNVPAFVMKQRRMLEAAFERDGIAVEQPEITSGAQQIQAVAAGAIDVCSVLGDASAILGRANGVPLTVMAAFSRSPKAFFIMTMANGPRSIEDLRGKRIAGPTGTTLHQLLALALASKGMRLTDVQHINMDLAAARAALLSGAVDAATLASNHVLAVEAAGGRSIANAEGLFVPMSVVAVRNAFLAQQPQLVQRYLAVHREALSFMAREPEQALALAAAEQRISVEDGRRMLPWYDFEPRMSDRDIDNMEQNQRFMIENGMLSRRIDIRRDLVHASAFAAG